MHDTTAIVCRRHRPSRSPLTAAVRAMRNSTGIIRASIICGGAPAATFRISPSNMPTAAPERTMPASGAIGRRSTPSSWCRAMASCRRCRLARWSCSAAATTRRSASRRWAVRRSSGRAAIFIWPAPPSVPAFLIRSRLPAARPSKKWRALRPTCSGFSFTGCPPTIHAVGLDLVNRAEAAGCRTLVLTLDVPVRTTRPREVATGIAGAFNVNLAILSQIARAPGWAAAIWKHGMPRFASLRSYVGADPSLNEVIAFAQREMRGAFTWDEVHMYRDRWKGTLIVKGILHPQDAETAVSLGVDGIIVSNHGGRQVEALPAAIDALPAIVRQVGKRATVLMDSGVRSGSDVVRACALGATAAFAGKAFLWGLGALGEEGPGYVIDLLIEETQAALGQLGAHGVEATRTLTDTPSRRAAILIVLRRDMIFPEQPDGSSPGQAFFPDHASIETKT